MPPPARFRTHRGRTACAPAQRTANIQGAEIRCTDRRTTTPQRQREDSPTGAAQQLRRQLDCHHEARRALDERTPRSDRPRRARQGGHRRRWRRRADDRDVDAHRLPRTLASRLTAHPSRRRHQRRPRRPSSPRSAGTASSCSPSRPARRRRPRRRRHRSRPARAAGEAARRVGNQRVRPTPACTPPTPSTWRS